LRQRPDPALASETPCQKRSLLRQDHGHLEGTAIGGADAAKITSGAADQKTVSLGCGRAEEDRNTLIHTPV